MRRDIDEALHDWPYDPEPGEVSAREVRARDGRTVLQIRVELGILQMEAEGRPDGTRPHGFATYLDYLRYRSRSKSKRDRDRETGDPDWMMSPEHCDQVDREFVQFYHRRIAWLALQHYDKALRDADHTLALMDFVISHGTNEEYISSHERFRGLVLFHRSQAAAALALERRKPDEAIDAVQEGMEKVLLHHQERTKHHSSADLPTDHFVDQLRNLEHEIRKNFAVEKTLREQLDEAVALEDYERAARLRDQIKARGSRR